VKHSTAPRFWELFKELPEHIQRLADKNFQLLKADPEHPSLHFKKIEDMWSVRVGAHYAHSASIMKVAFSGSGLAHTRNTTNSCHEVNSWCRTGPFVRQPAVSLVPHSTSGG
jgi:hypothetical protein